MLSIIPEEIETDITEHVDDNINFLSDSIDAKASGSSEASKCKFKAKPINFPRFNNDVYQSPPSWSQPSTPIAIQPPLSIVSVPSIVLTSYYRFTFS